MPTPSQPASPSSLSPSLPATPHSRGGATVKRILQATMDELSAVGVAATTIEAIATRAHVNKTTIYRRWGDKATLLQEALKDAFIDDIPQPNTGRLREDLFLLLKANRNFLASPRGKMLARIFLADGLYSEATQIAIAFSQQADQHDRIIIQRAIERGELPTGTNAELLLHIITAPIISMALELECNSIRSYTDDELLLHIDIILNGAKNLRLDRS